MNNKYLDVAIATDQGYLPLAETALVSLIDANPDVDIRIHLLSNNINSEDIDRIFGWLSSKNAAMTVYPIDNIDKLLGITVPSSISITSYARLFISDILPSSIDNILYIDCDVLVTGSIAELVDFDLKGSLVGGVLDPIIGNSYKLEIGIPVDEPYLNAGVLLIPLNKWRSLNLIQKFLNYLIEHNGKVHHHDQGIINAVCQGHKALIAPKYNIMSNCFSYGWNNIYYMMAGRYYDQQTFNKSTHEPVIIHFTGAELGRPWTDDCRHPYKNKFLHYYLRIPNSAIRHSHSSRLVNLEKWMLRNMPFSIFVSCMRVVNNLAYIKHKFK